MNLVVCTCIHPFYRSTHPPTRTTTVWLRSSSLSASACARRFVVAWWCKA